MVFAMRSGFLLRNSPITREIVPIECRFDVRRKIGPNYERYQEPRAVTKLRSMQQEPEPQPFHPSFFQFALRC